MGARRSSRPSPGEIRSHRLLGTTASYRVLRVERNRVRVAVVSAPKLDPGTEMWLTLASVASMDVLGAAADPAAPLPDVSATRFAAP